MLGDQPVVVFVPSTDLDRSKHFYGEVLGLEVVHHDLFAVVCRAGAVTLRVTDVGSTLRVQPFTVLGWEVDDVAAVTRQLAARGVPFLRPDGLELDDQGIWTAPDGTQVAWFTDPDGNTLSVDHHREP